MAIFRWEDKISILNEYLALRSVTAEPWLVYRTQQPGFCWLGMGRPCTISSYGRPWLCVWQQGSTLRRRQNRIKSYALINPKSKLLILITSVSKTIRKPPLAKAQTTLGKQSKIHQKRFSVWRMEFFHPAMWYVALGWHATEFAQTSAILEFYFRFRPHHRSGVVDMSFCEILSKSYRPRQKNDVMSVFKMAGLRHLGL